MVAYYLLIFGVVVLCCALSINCSTYNKLIRVCLLIVIVFQMLTHNIQMKFNVII